MSSTVDTRIKTLAEVRKLDRFDFSWIQEDRPFVVIASTSPRLRLPNRSAGHTLPFSLPLTNHQTAAMNMSRMSTRSLASSTRGSGPKRCTLRVVSVAQAPSLDQVVPASAHAAISSYPGIPTMAKQSVNRKQVVSQFSCNNQLPAFIHSPRSWLFGYGIVI